MNRVNVRIGNLIGIVGRCAANLKLRHGHESLKVLTPRGGIRADALRRKGHQ
ncbi:MAG TPA: hypothetical protein VGZ00_07035 [Candidatus Baltobacteraceae bacterium]|nr:hypothetical protein [Candidatus Baltobacteraceae bacterium]